MNKLIAAAAALMMSATMAAPAFAENAMTVTTDTSVASTADLTCMGNAVDVREGAVLTARTNYNAKVIAAITTRRASLKAAYTIANNNDRRVALKAAVDVYVKAMADARAQYRTDTKAAWKTFNDSIKACNLSADVRVKSETEHENNKDKGRHLGQLKKKIHNAFNVNAHGKADLDLSF